MNKTLAAWVVAVAVLAGFGCGSREVTAPPPAPASGASADSRFDELAHRFLEDLYERQPTQATYLGIHKYDDRLEDYSRQGVLDAIQSAREFRQAVTEIPSGSLSPDRQLD